MAKILIGIGGGIAAYKTATLISRLVQSNHQVDCVVTAGGLQFIAAGTLTALCGRPPVSDTYDSRFPLGAHIELAQDAQLLIVAPATARLLASCAMGLADDLLATLYLAVECPVLFAPAMNTAMWEKVCVQRHVEMLQHDGVHFVGPTSGWLSCRRQGPGRMAEPEDILAASEEILQPQSFN
ncbi:MAG: phosphopantothenoylcysteine decarboxylase [Planctomycetales bacterium]|nr:phosphopantothenoylcysteine decarboxylase [Planctomycetales bacterium]